MDQLWGALGAAGTLAGVVVSVVAIVVAHRAGRRADGATAQAVEAHQEAARAGREAAEALQRQAAVSERLLALEEVRSAPRPVRFRLSRTRAGGFLIQEGDLAAREVEASVEDEGGVSLAVTTSLPIDVFRGEALEFSRWRGGTPGRSTIRLSWMNEDGTPGKQTIVV